MKVGKKVKIASILLSAGILAAGLAGFTYVKVIPSLVSSPKTASYVADTLKKHAGLDLVIENAKLDTGFNPFVGFKVGKILLKNKDGAEVVDLQNFDIKLSFVIGSSLVFVSKKHFCKSSVTSFKASSFDLLPSIAPSSTYSAKSFALPF